MHYNWSGFWGWKFLSQRTVISCQNISCDEKKIIQAHPNNNVSNGILRWKYQFHPKKNLLERTWAKLFNRVQTEHLFGMIEFRPRITFEWYKHNAGTSIMFKRVLHGWSINISFFEQIGMEKHSNIKICLNVFSKMFD